MSQSARFSRPALFRRSLLALAMGLSGGLAQAESDALVSLKQLSLDELADIRVSIASHRSERFEDTAAAVSVLTSEDIRRSGATTTKIMLLAVQLGITGVLIWWM